MLGTRLIALTITWLLFTGFSLNALTFPVGYFHQVTALKGQVVGINMPMLQSYRWLRQSFSRKNVKLTLYKYRYYTARNDLTLVKAIVADRDGRFDFGLLEKGHYTLIVDDEKWGEGVGWFDVEVKELPHATEFVTVDVSPVFPDCTGGHELVVRTKP